MGFFNKIFPKIMVGEFNDISKNVTYIDGFCDCFEDLPEVVHAVQVKTPYNVEIKEFSGGFWVHGYKTNFK